MQLTHNYSKEALIARHDELVELEAVTDDEEQWEKIMEEIGALEVVLFYTDWDAEIDEVQQ